MSRSAECEWSREDAVSMARFRSGHSLELGAYCVRIGKAEDGLCRRCGEECEDTEHVLKCAAGELQRRVLGLPTQPSMGDLVGLSGSVLKYWKWWRRVRLRGTQ